MIKKVKVLITCIGMFSIMGCAKTEVLEDSYMEGIDYQYMYNDDSAFFPQQAKGVLCVRGTLHILYG